MKFIAINASPRKKWNTATILDHVLAGARGVLPEIETETVNLYEHSYKGCISCFQCKLLGGPSYGRCAVKDGITEYLEKIYEADCVAFGSPIYFGDVTGMLRCFFERLFFPKFVYDKNYSSLAPKKLRTAFVYTMNVSREGLEQYGYPQRLGLMESFAERLFGYKPHVQYVCDTYQFPDYSRYKMEVFKEADKAKTRETRFPLDCRKAEEIGASMAAEISGSPTV